MKRITLCGCICRVRCRPAYVGCIALLRPVGRGRPTGIRAVSLGIKAFSPGSFCGQRKLIFHTPRYDVAEWQNAQSRRKLRFYVVDRRLRLVPELGLWRPDRRALLYGVRRSAEIRHYPSFLAIAEAQ
jgi:hypothetical protein